MKVLYSWLKEFIDIDLPPEKVATTIEMLGIEVEDLIDLSKPFRDHLVVGEIVSVEPHPKADRLFILKIDIGRETIQQVSSAPDLYIGKKVVVALPGTVVKGITVGSREFRGVVSQGMLISEEELDLADSAESVIELPDDARPGDPPFKYLGLDDYLFELYTPTNRADLLSIIGIAREISAKLNIPLNAPTTEFKPDLKETFRVMLEDTAGCPRYTLRLIRGVKVGKAPPWIRYRLALSGIRSINNVVDITNYVMLETGHPLHAFDLNRIEDLIVVRRAKDGEQFVTLDGDELRLNSDILVIADAQKPVAIAGIVGGVNSGVTENTTDILLESAYFSPEVIRRGSSLLSIQTESSRRFSRGVDPEGPKYASERFSYLLKTITEASVSTMVDVYPNPIPLTKIVTSGASISNILGVNVSNGTLIDVLKRLNFNATEKEDRVIVIVPSYRQDVKLEEDLAEEYARLVGYDEIPGHVSASGRFVGKSNLPNWELISSLVNSGFTEVKTLEFVSEKMAKFFSDDTDLVKIKNPLGPEYAVLRTSLLPGLLSVASINLRRGIPYVEIFEIGKVFFWQGEDKLPEETVKLCVVVAGKTEDNWVEPSRDLDIYDLKRALTLLSTNYLFEYKLIPAEFQFLEIGAKIVDKNNPEHVYGWIGVVGHELCRLAGLKTKVAALEINIEGLKPQKPYFEIPKFPPVKLDLSLLVDKSIDYQKIEDMISSASMNYLDRYWLIDLFEGPPLPEGKKSMTLRFRFLNPTGTLDQNTAQSELQKLVNLLQKQNIVVRGLSDGT